PFSNLSSTNLLSSEKVSLGKESGSISLRISFLTCHFLAALSRERLSLSALLKSNLISFS
ncbi:TPA: hypothetical protein ACSP2D_003430, partial [Aeromonas veronii]